MKAKRVGSMSIRWIGIVASILVISAPMLRLTTHPLIGGMVLYDHSLRAAVAFVLIGVLALWAWGTRRLQMQLLVIPLLYGSMALTVSDYREGQRNVREATLGSNPATSSFAEIMLEYQEPARGWVTLWTVIIVLTVVTCMSWFSRRGGSPSGVGLNRDG